jgi:hypothetical protein
VLTPEARPLYAAHADLPWPEEPLLELWHGVTLLREHRGDGHQAALLGAGLTGLEALVTHTVTGRGFTESGAKATRGWSDEDWAATIDSLTARGLLADGRLTPDGEALRARVEAATDERSAAPWAHLGPERTARAVELGKDFSARIAAAGAYPSGLFAGR